MGLVLSCWTVALRSWASALRKSSASGSDLLRRLGLSIGIAAHRHFCTSERRCDGTTVRRNDARDGGRFSAPLRASSLYNESVRVFGGLGRAATPGPPRDATRATQKPPKTTQDGPRATQEPPRGAQKARNHAKTTQKQRFLQGFVKIAFGGQEPPMTPQRRPKKPPGRPQSGREQPRDGPREAQEPPRVTPRCAQGPPGPAKELPSSLEEGLWRPKLGPKRGSGEAQKRPRGGPVYHTRGKKSREATARRYKRRQDNRRQDQRQNKTTHGQKVFRSH